MTDETHEHPCPSCGAGVRSTTFCEACGARQPDRLDLSGDGEQPGPAPAPAAARSAETRSVMTRLAGVSRRWWLLGAAVAAIVAVVIVGAVVVGNASVASARAAYEETLAEYSALLAERDIVETAALEALAPEASDPADDPTLIDQVTLLLEVVQQSPTVDVLDVDQTSDVTAINDSRSALDAVVAEVRTDLDALEQAVDALLSARIARVIDAALTELDRAIADGETALAGSEGRVSDESVRTALRAAIDAGRSEIDTEERDPESISAATAAIRTAIADVAAARVPAFTDIDGTWCYWENIDSCVTIALPRVGEDSVVKRPGANSFYPPRGDGWTYVVPGEPCFTTSVAVINGDPFGGAVLIYCPRGVAPSDEFQNFTNLGYERVYISQQGAIDPYFRIDEWRAATGR